MEYGKVNLLDFNITIPNNDDAYVLFDKGEVKFSYNERKGYVVIFTKTKRILIGSDKGMEQAEVEVPLYHGSNGPEAIYSFEACSYNIENSAIVTEKIGKKDLLEEKLTEKHYINKFTLPKVKKGTVIEYTYKIESPYIFQLPEWRFQDRIPTKFSQYTISMIPIYSYIYTTQGISKFSSTKQKILNGKFPYHGKNYDVIKYEFVMENTIGFKDEKFISSRSDYIQQLQFQLSEYQSSTGSIVKVLNTYEKYIDELRKDARFGKYIKKSTSFAKKVFEEHPELIEGTKQEQVEKMIRFVKDELNFNKIGSILADASPKKVYEDKEGNIAEINFFLGGLLNAIGVEVEPVILSTRGNGKINKKYPFQDRINYVILLINIDGRKELVDASEPLLDNFVLPIRCNNGDGLVIGAETTGWVKVGNKSTSLNSTIVMINAIDVENKVANVSYVNNTNKLEAYKEKLKFENNNDLIKKKLIDRGFKSLDKFKSQNYDSYIRNYRIAASGATEIETFQEHVVILPFLKIYDDENPFTQHIRTYPIDFVNAVTNYGKSTIVIPEGYEFVEGPKSYSLKNYSLDVIIDTKLENDKVSVEFKFNIKKAMFAPEDYFMIKKVYDKYLECITTPVVLKKSVEQ
ncbi:hypothetical protein NH26_00110 [Flammeovirga pacifica]|uniref:DUF3857 domain-containing protein n=2 Tax=Flammeovirga pacifica TaxID=915059 RepID=A0A1S1YVK4_FLAPC|nr:hypothetical protein NH26_00110 [Flammeovirga pacifica]